MLDRPGGRWLLAQIVTRYARQVTGNDVSVLHDGVWICRSGSRYQADSHRFSYYADDMRRWEGRLSGYDRDARDCWFHTYSPKHGDVIIDIGAGAGTDMPTFSQAVGPRGRILAIEAHPDTFQYLQKTCEYNRLTNVTCVHAAVMDRADTVFIESSAAHESNRIELQSGLERYGTPVQASTVDDLCAQHGIERIDFLKMNIEGAERMAILGMQRIIKNTQCVVIACHDFRSERGDDGDFSTKQAVVSFLLEHGFEIHIRDDDPRQYVRDHVHGVRPDPAANDGRASNVKQ
jgi:FkbM family methyltransferase